MKKVVALLLALVMVFSMAACAKAPAQDSSTKNPQAEGPAEQSKIQYGYKGKREACCASSGHVRRSDPQT